MRKPNLLAAAAIFVFGMTGLVHAADVTFTPKVGLAFFNPNVSQSGTIVEVSETIYMPSYGASLSIKPDAWNASLIFTGNWMSGSADTNVVSTGGTQATGSIDLERLDLELLVRNRAGRGASWFYGARFINVDTVEDLGTAAITFGNTGVRTADTTETFYLAEIGASWAGALG